MEKNAQPQAINAEKLLRHWLAAMKRCRKACSGTVSGRDQPYRPIDAASQIGRKSGCVHQLFTSNDLKGGWLRQTDIDSCVGTQAVYTIRVAFIKTAY